MEAHVTPLGCASAVPCGKEAAWARSLLRTALRSRNQMHPFLLEMQPARLGAARENAALSIQAIARGKARRTATATSRRVCHLAQQLRELRAQVAATPPGGRGQGAGCPPSSSSAAASSASAAAASSHPAANATGEPPRPPDVTSPGPTPPKPSEVKSSQARPSHSKSPEVPPPGSRVQGAGHSKSPEVPPLGLRRTSKPPPPPKPPPAARGTSVL